MATITGIVHTKNEESNLAGCIRSLHAFCDAVLVVDMESTDRTVEIAQSLGAEILRVPDHSYADPARAMAIRHVGQGWIMRLDADEVVPAPLGVRLRNLADADEADVASIGRLNFMFGQPLRYSGWGPETDRGLYFFKHDALELPDRGIRIHEQVRAHKHARVAELPTNDDACVWHFNYDDWSHFLGKLDRYTTIEAQELLEEGRRVGRAWLLLTLLKEIWGRGIRHTAWRDGYRGFALVWMQMTYRWATYAKARQLRSVGDAAAIRARYAEFRRQAAKD